MIKNLIFDFGKVLVDVNFELIQQKYFPIDAPGIYEFAQILFDSDFMDRSDYGHEPLIELIEKEKAKNPHLAVYFDTFYNCFDDFISAEMEGMYDLLVKLKAAGFGLYGLSNWQDRVYGIMKRFPIFNLLDGRIISCEEHCIKPEPEIYERLLSRFGLKAEECLFADDKLKNVEGAKRVGMQGVVFTDSASYLNYLRSEGIVPDSF